MLKNKKQGWIIFAAMAILFLMVFPVIYYAEKAGNPVSTCWIKSSYG